MIYSIADYGAVGDGVHDNTGAIQEAVNYCYMNGGGKVYCPPGSYLTGTIELKSNVELNLSSGCAVIGSSRKELYLASGAPYDRGSVKESTSGTHLITAWKQKNIAITGYGTIDGSGTSFFSTEEIPGSCCWEFRGRWRPGQMIALLECDNVAIENVTMANSAYWTVWLYACNRVKVRGINIFNDWRTPNGDGISADCCEDVMISDCNIHAGDDAIALRADQAKADIKKPLENVLISNCVISTRFGGIRFGPSGDKSVIRNVSITNCVIKEATKGILMSLWHRGKWDHGVLIENVSISNMVINAVSPFRMYIEGNCRIPCGIKGIMVQNVIATSYNTCNFIGNDKAIFEDIRLKNIKLNIHSRKDKQEKIGHLPEEYSNYGLYFKNISDISLCDITVETSTEASETLKNVLALDNVRMADILNIDCRKSKSQKNIITNNCSNIYMEGIKE